MFFHRQDSSGAASRRRALYYELINVLRRNEAENELEPGHGLGLGIGIKVHGFELGYELELGHGSKYTILAFNMFKTVLGVFSTVPSVKVLDYNISLHTLPGRAMLSNTSIFLHFLWIR